MMMLMMLVVVQIYSELGDDITHSDKQWVAMSCYFVRHGADLYLTNNQGQTAVSMISSPPIHSTLMSYIPRNT